MSLYDYALNSPINNIDEFGLYVTGYYGISDHHLHLVDEYGNPYDFGNINPVDMSPGNIFSGNGPYANDPAAGNIGGPGAPAQGPIPPGFGWYIKPPIHIDGHGFPANKIEYPLQVYKGGILPNRGGGYTIHPGRQSNGCITFISDVPMNDPNYPSSSEFDRLQRLLDSQTTRNDNIGDITTFPTSPNPYGPANRPETPPQGYPIVIL